MRPELLVLGAALLFGTTGTAQALGPATAPSVEVGAARLVVGGAVLVALAAVAEPRRGGHGHGPPALRPVLLAAVGVALYQACFFAGVARTGVAVGTAVALGSAPAATGALALALRGDRPEPRWAAATAVAVVGCGLLLLPGGASAVDPIGVALALGAGTSYALYTVAGKDALDAGTPAPTLLAGAFGLAAILLSPVLLLGDPAWLGASGGLALALYLGLAPTALAYVLFARGLRLLEPARVATLTLAEPLAAVVLGVALLGERPTVAGAFGAALLLAGLLVAGRSPGGSEGHGGRPARAVSSAKTRSRR